MNPSHIYFKEIDIDQDTFTANFAKENEIENVIFNKDSEYGITRLNINFIRWNTVKNRKCWRTKQS